MSAWTDHWPLARRWAFLKPRLLRSRQKSHAFQVDFCPLPDIVENVHGFWLGLVVDPRLDLILATSILAEPPIVQDLAEILFDAMQCRLPCGSFRPEIVLLRDNPKWVQLFPLLEQVGIEAVITEDLLSWDEKADELTERLKNRWLARSESVVKRKDESTDSEILLEVQILAHHFLYFEQPKCE